MSHPQWSQYDTVARPAQLAFLAIYSPSLGPTDETFADQLVYYYSRAADEARAAARRNARDDAAGGDAARAQENEKLRHIGLAQGMVDFARGFSEGMPVDSIDTEKSRIVLHELEKDWWVLASIDLTRLPSVGHSSSETPSKSGTKQDTTPAVEYSSREVSPPALLLQQLLQAHYIFTLHHGPSLSELFVRSSRDKLCASLERYWTRFCRSWNVLLHGNPAIDIFSGIKLSSGGELGMGVGEEEWGSGEREVLEDLTRRTKGLVDLVVSRFGEPAASRDDQPADDGDALPWMGSGTYPAATDGLVFSGVGSITRRSLRNISLWMRQIYTYGDHAYGVRDNPTRERRKRRRRNPPADEPESNTAAYSRGQSDKEPARNETRSNREMPERPSKLQSRSNTDGSDLTTGYSDGGSDRDPSLRPAIPPPIVASVERSLDRATQQAGSTQNSSQSGEPDEDTGTTLGIPDQYMKYLTLGLSTLAKPSRSRPETSRQSSVLSSKTSKQNLQSSNSPAAKPQNFTTAQDDNLKLKSMDPMPDDELNGVRVAIQKRQETNGHFLIGLKGDLDSVPEDSTEVALDSTALDEFGGTRTVLRTLQIEMVQKKKSERTADMTSSQQSRADAKLAPVNVAMKNYRRLRVLIYVHRPFMYCFLFEDRAPSLSITSFYKELHQNLLPIHKSLLSSTSVMKIAQRLEDANVSAGASDNSSVASGSRSPSKTSKPNHVYDLIYDPALLTIHTSVRNIPEPGTLDAEGIVAKGKASSETSPWPAWTRIEALNAHSQILDTLASTKRNQHEYERTSRTNRGWWVVWMKLPPLIQTDEQAESSPHKSRADIHNDDTEFTQRLDSVDSNDTVVPSKGIPTSTKHAPQLNRIAFVVRKALDTPAAKSTPHNRTISASTSLWNALSLRPSVATDDAANASPTADSAPPELSGGIGFDARKYIEGLLSLNR